MLNFVNVSRGKCSSHERSFRSYSRKKEQTKRGHELTYRNVVERFSLYYFCLYKSALSLLEMHLVNFSCATTLLIGYCIPGFYPTSYVREGLPFAEVCISRIQFFSYLNVSGVHVFHSCVKPPFLVYWLEIIWLIQQKRIFWNISVVVLVSQVSQKIQRKHKIGVDGLIVRSLLSKQVLVYCLLTFFTMEYTCIKAWWEDNHIGINLL